MRYFKRPDNSPFYPEYRSTPYCVEYLDGSKWYYSHDQILHRENGPTYINPNGSKLYYLNGKFYGYQYDYTDESWTRFVKLKAFI